MKVVVKKFAAKKGDDSKDKFVKNLSVLSDNGKVKLNDLQAYLLESGPFDSPKKSISTAQLDKLLGSLSIPSKYSNGSCLDNARKFIADHEGEFTKLKDIKLGDKLFISSSLEDPMFGDLDSPDLLVKVTKLPKKYEQLEAEVLELVSKPTKYGEKHKVGDTIYGADISEFGPNYLYFKVK